MNAPINEPARRKRSLAAELAAVSRYGIAVAAVLAALGVRLSLFPVLGEHSPYLPFTLAVVIAARFGGRWPGLAATALSALSVDWFFLEPLHNLGVANSAALGGLALFVAVGCLISLFVGDLRELLLATAQAEEALRRHAQLINLSHDAIVTMDSNRHIVGWNAGAEEMYGWTEREAAGKVTHQFLQTSGSVSNDEVDEIVRRAGQWDGELSHITRGGRRLFVESRQVQLRDEKGLPLGILEINRDITERKQAENALREALEQRRLALTAANLGTWEYRFDTGKAIWDERYRAIVGAPEGGPIGFDEAIARLHPDDRAAVEEAIKQALAGINGGAYHREYRVVWPDGSAHWVASTGRVFFEGDGDGRRAVRFAGVIMETTERRQAEERLRQTQKLESIGLLAGGVAHDFNNLLTVIMGSVSLALTECPSCEHSQAILAAAERAAYLTKQLLAYAGKGEFVRKAFDLTDLVSRSTRLLTASVSKRVSLVFNLSADLPLLEADPSRIEQILMNLVINAGEAIPLKTDGRIEIATDSYEVTPEMARHYSQAFDVQAGHYVCLEVRDNGSGMDEATVSHIFDPFFTTKFTGRGLGLAAVHGIVRSSKGFIEVHSSPGRGATFQVFLPASGKKRAAELAPAAPRQQVRGSSTILVVDDEEMVRKLACAALRQHGYELLDAEDGRDALQVLAGASTLPSLVLLDLAMPVMGGDELAPILEKKYPGLKILVSSGFPEEDARRGFATGNVTGFLQKPYTVAQLAEKVAEVLSGGPE